MCFTTNKLINLKSSANFSIFFCLFALSTEMVTHKIFSLREKSLCLEKNTSKCIRRDESRTVKMFVRGIAQCLHSESNCESYCNTIYNTLAGNVLDLQVDLPKLTSVRYSKVSPWRQLSVLIEHIQPSEFSTCPHCIVLNSLNPIPSSGSGSYCIITEEINSCLIRGLFRFDFFSNITLVLGH